MTATKCVYCLSVLRGPQCENCGAARAPIAVDPTPLTPEQKELFEDSDTIPVFIGPLFYLSVLGLICCFVILLWRKFS